MGRWDSTPRRGPVVIVERWRHSPKMTPANLSTLPLSSATRLVWPTWFVNLTVLVQVSFIFTVLSSFTSFDNSLISWKSQMYQVHLFGLPELKLKNVFSKLILLLFTKMPRWLQRSTRRKSWRLWPSLRLLPWWPSAWSATSRLRTVFVLCSLSGLSTCRKTAAVASTRTGN